MPLQVRIIDGVQSLTETDRQRLLDAGVTPSEALDGFVSGNELVINRRNANTRTQVSLLAAHEILGHVGMRARYGNRLNQTLDQYYRRTGRLAGVTAAAELYGVSLQDQYPTLYERSRKGDKVAQRALTQELFAAAAESNFLTPGSTVANGVSDFVSRVKGFLARFPGLGKLFNTFTEKDIMRVVRDSAKAARRTAGAPAPIDTAASIGGAARRVAGVGSKDYVVYREDGGTTVIKQEERGEADDGGPVRKPNDVVRFSDPIEAATDKAKQAAANTVTNMIGTALDQTSPSRDPLKRGPDQGTARKKLRDQSWLVNLQENFADSQTTLRRLMNDVRKFYGSGDRLKAVGVRIDETLDDILIDSDVSRQDDAFQSAEDVLKARLVSDVQQDLNESIYSTDPLALSDAMSLHSKTVRAKGLAMEHSRDVFIDLDTTINDAVNSLGTELGITPEEAMESASAVATALSSIEKNDAIFLMTSEVDSVGQIQRKRVLDRYESLQTEGAVLSPAAAAKMREELEQIGRARYNGQAPSYDEARLDTNTTGLSTRAANTLLTDANVTPENTGRYTGILDAIDATLNITNEMRAETLPQAFFNERVLHGFKHDYPVESVDLEKYPLYANIHTQRGFTDFTSEAEQRSQFTDNTIHNVRIQAMLASQAKHFNSEVARSLLLNVLAHESSDTHQSATNGFFAPAEIKAISKNDQAYREYAANLLRGKEAQNTIIYSVPNSDAAVLMRFDDKTSKVPLQVRGERRGEDLRQWTAFRAARTATGTMSKLMTRYNANFIPRSHVREMLTAGLFIGSEEGLGAVGTYTSKLLDNNAHVNDIYTYMRLRNTRTKEAEAKRKQLLIDSPVARQLQDLISESGLVTQLSALSEPGQADITRRSQKGLSKATTEFDNWFGTLSDASDALVRLSAYQTQLELGKSKQEAATYAKRLANFEARGRYSGPLSDIFMFYNPSAIGASRTLESLTEGEFARPAMFAAVGAGLSFGLLAAAFSPDDEENPGKKLIDREGLDRQTTDIRIPISDKTTITIPAGFTGMSVGFLVGNQIAGFLRGKQDISQLAANTYEIATNNFSPIPASGIPLVDAQGNGQFGRYLVDTVTPSFLRPYIQFQFNMNGLGLPIYREGFGNTAGGLTDAFNGRESDIGTWSDRLAIALHEGSNGALDYNPGTLRHFMSSYFNGVNAVMDFGAEAANVMEGGAVGHSFIDRSLGFGGFFSKTGHFDDYYKTRRAVDSLSKQLKTYEATGRTELAQNLRQRLPPNFEEIIKDINRNKRAQDKVNSEMRPLLYADDSTVSDKRAALDLQNERRRQLQVEGLALMNQIVQPSSVGQNNRQGVQLLLQ